MTQEECQRTSVFRLQRLEPVVAARNIVLEQERRSSGNHGQRDKQRRGKHVGNGQREGQHQLVHHARSKHDGQEYANGSKRGSNYRARNLLRTLNGCASRRNAAAAQAIDILQHNNRIIYQHANSDGNTAKRHNVQRDAREVHHHQGAEH